MMRTQEEQNILNQRTRNKDGQWRKKRSKNGDRRPSCSVGCEPYKEYGKKGCEGCIDGRRNKIS